MITAVDTNVILDLFDGSSDTFLENAAAALKLCSREGSLVVSTTTYSELAPSFVTRRSLDRFLADVKIAVTAPDLEEAFLAGKLLAEYKRERGRRGRILPDFFVGAHAMLHAGRLLTGDERFYREAFRRLHVSSPRELIEADS